MADILNDFNYRDLSFNPDLNQKGDISVVTDKQAIRQSLFNIIHTIPGQRIMEPNFGGDVKSLLFEPLDEETANLIGERIQGSIEDYEPRITLIRIDVQIMNDDPGYNIDVYYVINDLQEADTINVELQKL